MVTAPSPPWSFSQTKPSLPNQSKVVLAASVCTKAGKPLVARHFVDMPRARIEGLLASFPKLIGSSDQHTFVETDAVRYVYQPLEELFLVLITNKQSNILQDIDSLHLFARIVSETCRSRVDEREVSRNAFELINVFDEVVCVGGYRESVNLGHIRTIVEMESHEERIQEEIERNKEREAKEELARRSKLMDAQRREAAKRGYGGASSGFGGGGGSSNYGGFSSSGGMGGGGGSGGFDSTPKPSYTESTPSYNSAPAARPIGGKGMQLGKKQDSTAAMFEAIKKDEGLVERDRTASANRTAGAAPVSSVRQEAVHIAIDERISARVSRDGGLENMEVKGKMELKVTDPAKAHFRVSLADAYNDTIQFTTHPNVDKALFATGVIGLRDPTKPFPVNQSLPLVKWRFLSKDDSLMPLSINCWPSPSGSGSCDVNIEYELQVDRLELRDVTISIPYPGQSDPVIQSADGNNYRVNRQARTIEWNLPLIDSSNKNGVMEFTVQDENVEGFFPIKVNFSSVKPYCSVNVGEVMAADGSRVAFSKEALLMTEEYVIV
ncbi:Coatomer subunit delta [Rhizoclosmatium sp. JEL0117]|nr:Coatomer subunit delta [Rhizoclosmatium sp. JEL0117]